MNVNLSVPFFSLLLLSSLTDCFAGPHHTGQNAWYVSASGNDASGDGSQSNPWKSIQYANDNASVHDGDTVYVAAGTYTEKITVTKSLKIYGPNHTVSPNPTTAYRTAEAVINALGDGNYIFEVRTPGTNVEIKGLKFLNGAPLHDGHYPRSSANSNDVVVLFEKNWVHHCINVFCGTLTTWKKVSIIDNFFDQIDLIPLASAVKLNDANDPPPAAQRAANVIATITDNRIDSTTWAGILLDNIYSSTVLRNVVKNVPETGIELAGGIGNADVGQNVIQKANGFHVADVAGLKIYGSEFTGVTNIHNNTVTGSYNGFAVKDGEDISGKNIHVFNNSFDNTNAGHAIYHGGAGALDAGCNWLGTSGTADASTRVTGPVSTVRS